jgi:PilZ domain-containing protein
MKFTDTQFAQAIELIQAFDGIKSRKDKRRAARTAIRVPIAIKLGLDSKTEWLEAKLHDVSPRGAKLETAAAMEIGSSFLLRLPAKNGKQGGVPLICRVAHCVPQKNSFLIGAEFIGRLATQRSAGDNAADLDRIQRSILD